MFARYTALGREAEMKEEQRVTPGVWREPIVVAESSDGLRVDRIHYPPGGHTHWHLHTKEQVLWRAGPGLDQVRRRASGVADPG